MLLISPYLWLLTALHKEKIYSCPIESSSSKKIKSFQCGSESSFIYTGNERNIIWEEAGISLFFPAAGYKTRIKFSIKLVSDDYILPPQEHMELVSAIYKIAVSDILPKPVRILMEHCAVVEEEDILQFMVAHGEPPYQFKPLAGGRFQQGEVYGEIELVKFCKLSITRMLRRHSKTEFAVHIYCKDGFAEFVVTKNLKSHIADVKKNYSTAIKLVAFALKCPCSTTSITLSIPSPLRKDGWVVKPVVNPPSLEMDTIKKYKPGKVIPNIKLSMKWKGGGQPREESVQVEINGADVNKSFDLPCALFCTPLHKPTQCYMSGASSCFEPDNHNECIDHLKQFSSCQANQDLQHTEGPLLQPALSDLTQELKDLAWPDVHNMAIQLELKVATLTNIELQYPIPSNRLSATMDAWLASDKHASWKKIIKALKAIGQNFVAESIRTKRVTDSR